MLGVLHMFFASLPFRLIGWLIGAYLKRLEASLTITSRGKTMESDDDDIYIYRSNHVKSLLS